MPFVNFLEYIYLKIGIFFFFALLAQQSCICFFFYYFICCWLNSRQINDLANLWPIERGFNTKTGSSLFIALGFLIFTSIVLPLPPSLSLPLSLVIMMIVNVVGDNNSNLLQLYNAQLCVVSNPKIRFGNAWTKAKINTIHIDDCVIESTIKCLFNRFCM